MIQYLDLLRTIKEKGTHKDAAREGMPGTTSLFGHQMRLDLSEGFPMVTTKKISFKNIVVELLWFLRGDTNIKYLVDNDCNIWNEDAYNYYLKITKRDPKDFTKWERMEAIMSTSVTSPDNGVSLTATMQLPFDHFCAIIKNTAKEDLPSIPGYTLGDCGEQYGKLWRDWNGGKLGELFMVDVNMIPPTTDFSNLEQLREIVKGVGLLPVDYSKDISSVKWKSIDQVIDLIKGLKSNPMSRRHIITAWNPATLNDMALNACHALVQFNCRPIGSIERAKQKNISFDEYIRLSKENGATCQDDVEEVMRKYFETTDGVQYYLDCQMYQRSADVFLGVPYNIASYALLTHIIAKICNMIPGEFIHPFGDVHIYDNHMEQVDLQLTREPMKLPTLEIVDTGDKWGTSDISELIETLTPEDFILHNYESHPAIKAKLSTGLK